RRTQGRRRGSMGQTRRACAAFGAVLIFAGCSHSPAALPSTSPTGTSLPTATASATSSPTSVVFASTRYSYSITLPTGWLATPARATWDGTGAPTSEDPVVDLFGSPDGVRAAFALAAPTKSTLAAWVADGIRTSLRYHSDTCLRKP